MRMQGSLVALGLLACTCVALPGRATRLDAVKLEARDTDEASTQPHGLEARMYEMGLPRPVRHAAIHVVSKQEALPRIHYTRSRRSTGLVHAETHAKVFARDDAKPPTPDAAKDGQPPKPDVPPIPDPSKPDGQPKPDAPPPDAQPKPDAPPTPDPSKPDGQPKSDAPPVPDPSKPDAQPKPDSPPPDPAKPDGQPPKPDAPPTPNPSKPDTPPDTPPDPSKPDAPPPDAQKPDAQKPDAQPKPDAPPTTDPSKPDAQPNPDSPPKPDADPKPKHDGAPPLMLEPPPSSDPLKSGAQVPGAQTPDGQTPDAQKPDAQPTAGADAKPELPPTPIFTPVPAAPPGPEACGCATGLVHANNMSPYGQPSHIYHSQNRGWPVGSDQQPEAGLGFLTRLASLAKAHSWRGANQEPAAVVIIARDAKDKSLGVKMSVKARSILKARGFKDALFHRKANQPVRVNQGAKLEARSGRPDPAQVEKNKKLEKLENLSALLNKPGEKSLSDIFPNQVGKEKKLERLEDLSKVLDKPGRKSLHDVYPKNHPIYASSKPKHQLRKSFTSPVSRHREPEQGSRSQGILAPEPVTGKLYFVSEHLGGPSKVSPPHQAGGRKPSQPRPQSHLKSTHDLKVRDVDEKIQPRARTAAKLKARSGSDAESELGSDSDSESRKGQVVPYQAKDSPSTSGEGRSLPYYPKGTSSKASTDSLSYSPGGSQHRRYRGLLPRPNSMPLPEAYGRQLALDWRPETEEPGPGAIVPTVRMSRGPQRTQSVRDIDAWRWAGVEPTDLSAERAKLPPKRYPDYREPTIRQNPNPELKDQFEKLGKLRALLDKKGEKSLRDIYPADHSIWKAPESRPEPEPKPKPKPQLRKSATSRGWGFAGNEWKQGFDKKTGEWRTWVEPIRFPLDTPASTPPSSPRGSTSGLRKSEMSQALVPFDSPEPSSPPKLRKPRARLEKEAKPLRIKDKTPEPASLPPPSPRSRNRTWPPGKGKGPM